MSNKKIDINPDLFSIGKTRKRKEKKQKPTNVPLISPSVLKNKLLKRIKEHKIKETEDLENNKKKLTGTTGGINSKPNLVNLEEYTDEFNDSINYLQTLSKQKKENEQNAANENNKMKMKEELERRTVKNYQSLLNNSNLPQVNIELPEELKEHLQPINTSQFVFNTQPSTQSPIILKSPYNIDTSVPYGCLKNGIKPSYKDWNKTQKNMIVTNPNLSVVIGSNISSNISERENRLQNLKNKIKDKQIANTNTNTNIITNTNTNTNTIQTEIKENKPETPIITGGQETSNKQILKRTIRRKYTLGKTANNRSVGVLIKDRNTRKKVLVAQRDLKKKSINDIKSYLKDHNLIKVGSNAPNDVLRKMYESSMLAGEITNSNSDILLHNLLKDDKEL